MIYILHGENLPEIRNFILKLQDDNNVGSMKELAIEDTTAAEVSELISSVDMFGATQMVVLDVTKMGRMNVNAYVETLSSVSEDLVFVVFAAKTLSKANAFIKNAVKLKARVMPFKEISKSNVFKFVDYVFNGNRVAAYKELRNLILSGEDSFYIFSMLTYGLRNISYAKFDSPSFNKISPYVKSKAKSQAQRFSEKDITQLYGKYYELDVGAKSGTVNPELLATMGVEAVFSTISV